MTRILLALLLVGCSFACVYMATLGPFWFCVGVLQGVLAAINVGQSWGAMAEHESWVASFDQRHNPSVPGALPKEK